MTETVGTVVQGGSALPRKKSAGYTWASVHLPIGLAEDIKRVARREHRTVSYMVRLLCAEALQARGELTDQAEGQEDRDEENS